MKRFFDLTFRPFFILTGIGTAAAFVYAFWPEWAVPNIAKFPLPRGVHDTCTALGDYGRPDGRFHGRRRLPSELAQSDSHLQRN